jgi:hypothetical protein
MKDLLNTLETIWCETMHDRVMWPIHGRYLCSTCLREYPVAFHDTETQRHGGNEISNLRVPAAPSRWKEAVN